MAERSQSFLLQQVLSVAKSTRHFTAAAQHLIIGHGPSVLGPGHARQWNFATLELRGVSIVIGRRAQLVVTAAEELEKVVEKFSRSCSLDVVLQLELADA